MNLRKLIFGLLVLSIVLNGISLLLVATAGQKPMVLTPLTTLVVFLFAVLHAGASYGWRRGLTLVAIVVATGLAFESVGVASGAVYGSYHYTDQLGPKFLGLVPFLIPVAWFMMIYPSFRIADQLATRIIPRGFWRGVLTAGLAAVAMTAWDLAMDPMMVMAGHWVWEQPGAYFGVPIQNFWGWWLTTFTVLALYQLVLCWLPGNDETTPPVVWAVLSYAVMGVTTVATDFMAGLSGPGMVGVFAMLPWVAIGWINSRTKLN
ncbi:MAG: carotenoid biosynthesis protein [Chloroflexi bacterium]|nr:carotenoid biosynthesis protein [Chloroflexota bacterium]